jgi:hypothetical protein
VNFAPTDTQQALLDALGKLLEHAGAQAVDGQRSFFSAGLDAALEESSMLDAAAEPEFGLLTAALVVDQICRQPAIVEASASSLLRPLICPDWPRPLAVIFGAAERPARFLCEAKSVIFLDAEQARIAPLAPGDAVATPEFFAYPMGVLRDPAACLARAAPIGAADDVRRLMQIAIACEIGGAMQGAIAAVTEHVQTRRQFGRPLGAFQAIKHRLARAASAIAACRLLARRAADTGGAEDAMLALGYAQDSATAILYDLHQFMGAMGLTLEHPLYRWTYRIKLLLSEFGGASRQFQDLATQAWGDAA